MSTIESPEALTASVWQALETITDPCSRAMGAPAGVVSLGLVRAVEVKHRPREGASVRITLCITEPGCLMAAVFQQTAQTELAQLPGVGNVAVVVDHGHVWDPSQMAPDYRSTLSRLRAERLERMRALRVDQPR